MIRDAAARLGELVYNRDALEEQIAAARAEISALNTIKRQAIARAAAAAPAPQEPSK